MIRFGASLFAASAIAAFALAAPLSAVRADDPAPAAAAPAPAHISGPLDFTVKDIDGKEAPLSRYKGKVVMIVNTASKCGYTKQYASLEKLYEKYKDQGLVILAFPANNYGHQEPGSDSQIKEFCTGTYSTTFDLFSKISTKGEDQAPLYHYLTDVTTDPKFSGDIKWNFTKFLVDRNGKIVARFESPIDPLKPVVTDKVEEALKQKAS